MRSKSWGRDPGNEEEGETTRRYEIDRSCGKAQDWSRQGCPPIVVQHRYIVRLEREVPEGRFVHLQYLSQIQELILRCLGESANVWQYKFAAHNTASSSLPSVPSARTLEGCGSHKQSCLLGTSS